MGHKTRLLQPPGDERLRTPCPRRSGGAGPKRSRLIAVADCEFELEAWFVAFRQHDIAGVGIDARLQETAQLVILCRRYVAAK